MRAALAGATGLVGRELLARLIADDRATSILCVGRSAAPIPSPKVESLRVSFEALAEVPFPALDVAFCCLGTTIRKAGSQEAFLRVDRDYVLAFARACRRAGASRFVAVSALGANASSRVFYNRAKGEAERGLESIGFERLSILRPSLLLGARAEARPLEAFAQRAGLAARPLMAGPLRRWAPVEAAAVAYAMAKEAFDCEGEGASVRFVENEAILA